MEMNRKLFIGLMLATALAGAAHAADTIKIGVPVGLSGANSVVAPSVVQSTELAVEEINAAGGILGRQVEIIVADDGSGAQGAQKAFDSLVFKDKVDVLISMETSAARNAGLPMALLHKSGDGQVSPFPGQTYPTASVTGMPSAVKPLSTVTRTWNSAT